MLTRALMSMKFASKNKCTYSGFLYCNKRQRHSMTNLYGMKSLLTFILQRLWEFLTKQLRKKLRRLMRGSKSTLIPLRLMTRPKRSTLTTSPCNNSLYLILFSRAYTTLINKQSRAEYDEYVSQHIKLSHMWKESIAEEEDEEV